ncbi:ATP-dependent nuclease [Streptomyces prasinus]|uniref:ATP-dependent nuclease n=1 Tax=Streptomyces prasinus TaxID=67345 RepID=UPI002F3FDE79
MRISDISIENFKGLAHASFSDMAGEPVVVISGRNGTGKSHVLNALAVLWNEHYDLNAQVGPYGDECHISMSITLNEAEARAVSVWSQRVHGISHESTGRHTVAVRMNRASQTMRGYEGPADPVASILKNPSFQQEHPFSRLDYIPATRSLVSSATPAVNLGMFRAENELQERRQLISSMLSGPSPVMSLPDIASYLATLDYQGLIGARQGVEYPDEYGLIARAFHEATAKKILRPVMDRETGESGIYVEVSEGVIHPIDKLSSGEKSLLGLMYFVRRLSASGGVLLLDEPEQHLHPTLQAALFEAMKELAERAQVIVVSHSPNLISTVPVSGLLEVLPASESRANQITQLASQPSRMGLLAELGLTPAQVLQADGLLVVEGKTDQQFLSTVFPVEAGRVHILVAGDSGQVLAAHKTLSGLPLGLPWLCVRDRDLMTDEERSRLLRSHDNLHVWEQRAIESHLLNAELVHAVTTSLGKEFSLADVHGAMRRACDPLREEVLGGLVESELARRFPPPGRASQGSRFQKIKWQYEKYAAVNQERADALGEVEEEQRRKLEAEWSTEWRRLVDPKAALASLNTELRLFKSVEDFKRALLVRARDDLTVRPAGIEALRVRLLSVLDRTH